MYGPTIFCLQYDYAIFNGYLSEIIYVMNNFQNKTQEHKKEHIIELLMINVGGRGVTEGKKINNKGDGNKTQGWGKFPKNNYLGAIIRDSTE